MFPVFWRLELQGNDQSRYDLDSLRPVRFRGEADMGRQVNPDGSVEDDPQRDFATVN